MKAIIPAAGVGTRLRPHTLTLPKALLNVAGKPILGHILDDLHAAGVSEYVVVVGYHGDRVRDYCRREHADKRISFVEQEEMLGLGHAIFLCREAVGEGPVMAILGDTIVRADLPAIVGADGNVIAVCEVEDPRRFGVVEVDGERIVKFVEKPERPPSNLAIVGLYTFQDSSALFGALERVVREDVRTRGEYQLTDALQMMLEDGVPFTTAPIQGWHDCGKPETLLETNRVLLGEPGAVRAEGSVVVREPVSIHPDARLSDCIVGPHVTVARGARIEGAILSDSIVNEEAEVVGCVLRGSLIGPHARVSGRGVVLDVGDYSRTELH